MNLICIFLRKNLHMSEKSSTFAAAFVREHVFLKKIPRCYRLVA